MSYCNERHPRQGGLNGWVAVADTEGATATQLELFRFERGVLLFAAAAATALRAKLALDPGYSTRSVIERETSEPTTAARSQGVESRLLS